MFFKLTARNAHRDLVRNARRITIADCSDQEKSEAFQELWQLLREKLGETERHLNSQPAYAQRCEHWNQTDIRSIKPVKNMKNPWLQFKREFEQALTLTPELHAKRVGVALAWFYYQPWRDDWIV